MRETALIVWLTLCGVAAGQINVPANVEPYQPIVATLATPIAEGAEIQGGWEIPTAAMVQVSSTLAHIWAKPGTHQIAFRGAWLQTKNVELPNGETIQALIGFGFINETAVVVVGTPEPEPSPNPTPPPGPRMGVIIEETTARTTQQAQLWLQVRKTLPTVYLLDKDQLRGPLWEKLGSALREKPVTLPVLAVLDGDGNVLRLVPCPVTVTDIKAEVNK